MENWKAVPNTEEKLWVSNHGRVKSYLREKDKGYLLSPAQDGKGYLRIRFTLHGESRSYKVHRLVAEAFIANDSHKAQVNHIDGDKRNNNASNLEWCTNKENAHHAMHIGLWANVYAASARANERRKTAIVAIDLATGEETQFESVAAAERFFGSKHISAVIHGKRKQTAGHSFRREVM